MRCFAQGCAGALLAVTLLLFPRPLEGQAADSTLARITRLIAAGDRVTAHRLADSIVAATEPAAPSFADALFVRALSAADAASAERDYLRLAVEYPLSPRAAEALLRLAQLEYSRGDRVSALRHFERLVRDHPGNASVGQASFWTARIAFDIGDVSRACQALQVARDQIPASDVETRNQIDYFTPRCPTAAPADTAAVTPPPAATAPLSIQVAAFNRKAEAQALASRLKKRGFDVRVAGSAKPYRVRIGRYATRADAEAALSRVKQRGLTGRIVDAEPR
jgi:cell division septation protein DedD